MDGRGGSEPDWQNNSCISIRKIPPTSFSAPPPAGAMMSTPPSLLGLPCPGMMPAAYTGGPPMVPMMGPPPGVMPVRPAPRMRLPMEATCQ
jgi:U1 small nuclear ribonucleoprotein C